MGYQITDPGSNRQFNAHSLDTAARTRHGRNAHIAPGRKLGGGAAEVLVLKRNKRSGYDEVKAHWIVRTSHGNLPAHHPAHPQHR